jgi:hypothetical protein
LGWSTLNYPGKDGKQHVYLDVTGGLSTTTRFLAREISGMAVNGKGRAYRLDAPNPQKFDVTRGSTALQFIINNLTPALSPWFQSEDVLNGWNPAVLMWFNAALKSGLDNSGFMRTWGVGPFQPPTQPGRPTPRPLGE